MISDLPKSFPVMTAFPRSLSSVAVSVGGLAIFIVIASLFLVSHPIGSTIHVYFYGIDRSAKLVLPLSPANESSIEHRQDIDVDVIHKSSPFGSELGVAIGSSGVNNSVNPVDEESLQSGPNLDTRKDHEGGGVKNNSIDFSATKNFISNDSGHIIKGSDETSAANTLPDSKSEATPTTSALADNATKAASEESGCDLYHGSWFYDPLGPLYTNNTCPALTQMQNCQGNGRPDKQYENWRWKPFHCELPRFDAKKFLELMRGKTLAFIGDSVARNQMESMLCLLWQVEVPKNRGNKKMQRYYFRSTSTMIIRIWSSWLVHRTSEPFDFAPQGVDKLHLDMPDEYFMEYIQSFDVIVLSSGHWFAKRSVYILNNEIVGGQLWRPDKSHPLKINNIEAYGISVETILTSLVTHPNYTGLTIVRSYSPDHYEGGAWNTGGSCTGKEKPLAPGELVENGFTNIMHKKQAEGFDHAIKKATNKSKLKFMDVTEVFSYRHDGHPGPYRSPDPNKITKRGRDGRPPPQDCLHWCMPGPVDTWNELVLEIIRREFEANQSSSS
uniref:Protein YLS7 n=1 Tax=Rhizophora mucronata TaxID=61149 RepID=A0A2P2PIN9_RHIMU